MEHHKPLKKKTGDAYVAQLGKHLTQSQLRS